MKLINRYFLLGLGIGLIIASMFFSFVQKKDLSKQVLIEKARKIGMVFPDEIVWQNKDKNSDSMNSGLYGK